MPLTDLNNQSRNSNNGVILVSSYQKNGYKHIFAKNKV